MQELQKFAERYFVDFFQILYGFFIKFVYCTLILTCVEFLESLKFCRACGCYNRRSLELKHQNQGKGGGVEVKEAPI